jgi:hypothetical protein
LKRTEKEKSDYDKEKQPMNHIRKGDNSWDEGDLFELLEMPISLWNESSCWKIYMIKLLKRSI